MFYYSTGLATIDFYNNLVINYLKQNIVVNPGFKAGVNDNANTQYIKTQLVTNQYCR